ncbi:uncharacterized protein LY79DRAFT_572266, partial [Colletotrichum navitas]
MGMCPFRGSCHAEAETVKPPCSWAVVCRISSLLCCFQMRAEMFLRKASHFLSPAAYGGGLGLH